MVRIVIDIEDHGDPMVTKETVAMALEIFGPVRVVQIYDGGETEMSKCGGSKKPKKPCK